MDTRKKAHLLQLRRWRMRKKVIGTQQRPRMSVRFTNTNIYVQFIDDSARVTMAATSTLGKDLGEGKKGANVATASRLGTLAAQAAQGKGIKRVVFDRSAARYHGKVKALADAARAGGLQF